MEKFDYKNQLNSKNFKFGIFQFGYKGIESLSQTLIYFCNPISQTLDISNYEFCQIKQPKFEISRVYTIMLPRYKDWKILVCGKNSIPLKLSALTYFYRKNSRQSWVWFPSQYLYKIVISHCLHVCLFVCPIITPELLDRFASNFNWVQLFRYPDSRQT